MQSGFLIVAFTSLILSVLLAIFWNGHQAVLVEIVRTLSDNWNANPVNPLSTLSDLIKRVKNIKPEKLFLAKISKAQKLFILTLLCLVNAVTISILLIVLFGESDVIFLIIGTSASIFDILLVFLAFVIDKI